VFIMVIAFSINASVVIFTLYLPMPSLNFWWVCFVVSIPAFFAVLSYSCLDPPIMLSMIRRQRRIRSVMSGKDPRNTDYRRSQ